MKNKIYESDHMRVLRDISIGAQQLEEQLKRSRKRIDELELELDMANQIIECYEDGVAHG